MRDYVRRLSFLKKSALLTLINIFGRNRHKNENILKSTRQESHEKKSWKSFANPFIFFYPKKTALSYIKSNQRRSLSVYPSITPISKQQVASFLLNVKLIKSLNLWTSEQDGIDYQCVLCWFCLRLCCDFFYKLKPVFKILTDNNDLSSWFNLL